jgi:hypothetical protein
LVAGAEYLASSRGVHRNPLRLLWSDRRIVADSIERRQPTMTRLSGALAFLAVAAVALAASSAAGFNGQACSLVTAAAQRTAGVTGPCVQTTVRPMPAPAFLAEWGAVTSDHFLSVEVGAPTPAIRKQSAAPILPRPPRWSGPVRVAPGVLAYYVQSPFDGVANAAGKMKFLEHGYLTQIGLTDTSAPTLPGMMAVARSIAVRL